MDLQAAPVAKPSGDPEPAASTREREPYLTGLDGLRALAVIAVFFYHANSTWLPGGFLGVEVFFVISGFIITRSLVHEWQRSGRIDLGAFWLRRARRLLPALFLLLAGVVAYTAVFDRDTLARLREDVVFALAYVTNWHLIFSNQSYFDSWNHPSFIRHLWSLAIEEQFYLLWPLIFLGAFKLVRAKAALSLVLLGAVASYTAMALIAAGRPDEDLSRVYFGTDTRVGALLVGSAIGFLPLAGRLQDRVSRSRLLSFAGVIALGQLCLFSYVIEDRGLFLYQGGFVMTTLMTGLLILALNNTRSLPSRLLSLAPLRWVGVRSYGIYLYHWPILLLTWPNITSSLPTLALQAVATLVLAGLSYRLVEQPVRRGALGRAYRSLTERRAGTRRGFAAGFGLAATALVVGGLAITSIQARRPAPPPYLAVGQIRIISPSQAEDVSSQIQTVNPAPTPPAETPPPEGEQPGESPAPEPTPEATPEGSAAADQCAAIRGRAYESDEERTWFLANCVRQQPPPRPQGNTQPLPTFVATGTISVPGGVSAIGDSVMVGAGAWLAANFAGIDIDASVGRQVSQAVAMLRERAADGTLAQTVVLHLGNNGTFTSSQFDQIMEAVGQERRVFFINLHVPRNWEESNNAVISAGVGRYGNAYLIDWHSITAGHEQLFASDGVHLSGAGAELYTGLVVDATAQ